MDVIKITNTQDTFSIYTTFVDNYIKDANAAFVKVYIYIARHAQSGISITLDKIAADTGLLKSDVVDALKYWNTSGVISYSDSSITLLPVSSSESFHVQAKEPEQSAKTAKTFQPNTSVSSSYNAASVIKTVTSDENLAHLFAIISQLLNKSLSSNDYKIIYSFIDYLKLPEQVIIVLFEHCVSMAKTNMRYIEKIAYSWADSGINTPELAISYVRKHNDEQSILSHYKKNFKITGRDFTDTEIKLLMSWINDCKASEELIMHAYDTAVMNTGKISFRYMDAIIKSELSISAPNRGTSLPPNVKKSTFRNYPQDGAISEIEKQMIEKMMSQYGGEDNAVNK